jgi:hypothetical protein
VIIPIAIAAISFRDYGTHFNPSCEVLSMTRPPFPTLVLKNIFALPTAKRTRMLPGANGGFE